MLKLSRPTLHVAIGAAALAIVGVTLTMTSVHAQPWSSSPKDWSLSAKETAEARKALMLLVTQSQPNSTNTGRVHGAWPKNLTSGRSWGTDRATANAAMGTPGSAPATDHRPVVCVEARGTFSTSSLPRPPGAPVKTYSYVTSCFDPTTGDTLDMGYDDKPVTKAFASARPVDTDSPLP